MPPHQQLSLHTIQSCTKAMESAIKLQATQKPSSSTSAPSLRALEIKVISGEDLRINRRQSVKNSFVVIRMDSANSSCTDQIRTKTNTEGGSNPAWDEKLVIDMPMHARFVTVEVQCMRNGGNKIIGTATIPVSDFMGGLVPDDYLHFLSYRLRDTQGERNGIINLSVRIKNPGIGSAANFASFHPACYKQQQQQQQQPWSAGVPVAVDARFPYNNQAQVVTGIPVRLPNF